MEEDLRRFLLEDRGLAEEIVEKLEREKVFSFFTGICLSSGSFILPPMKSLFIHLSGEVSGLYNNNLEGMT